MSLIHHPSSGTWPKSRASAVPDAEMQMLRVELAESRRQFESILRSLSGLFYRCELEAPWRMSFVSDGVQLLTGYDPRDLDTQIGWAGLVHPEDRAAVEDAVGKAVAEKRAFDLTYRITHKSGETRWVAERGQAIYEDNGNPLFLEGVINDISGRKEADELQRTMLARWRQTLDAIPQMVWTMAADGTDEFYNAQWANFTGFHIGGTENLGRLDLVHVDDRNRVSAIWKEKFATGEPYEAQYRLKHVGGGYRWVLSRGQPELDSNGAPVRWYGTCTDIHDEVLGREALQASEAVSRSMIEATPDCISMLDFAGNIEFFNRAAIDCVGRDTAARLLGRPWAEAFSPASVRRAARASIHSAVKGRSSRFSGRQVQGGEERWWDVAVAPITNELGQLTGIVSIARDITHQKTAEDRVRWAANHDPLTQLPNRALFQQTMDRALSEARTNGNALTVLMMDLDDFKRTNDALGHDAGDALLVEFAMRLRETVRPDDMVARLGGDEFAVLLQGAHQREEIESAVRTILSRLKAPWDFEGNHLDLRTSIGASIFPFHGNTRAEILKNADIALYVAKTAERGGLRIFESAMRAENQKRSSMLSLARDAINEGTILPFYQPKVDLRTGKLDGFEALLRMEHPQNGVQTANTIAAAFEDGAIAAEISDHMIATVIADMRRWTASDVPFGHVAVNAGAAELRSPAFAERLLDGLSRAKLPPSSLQVEVTETVFLGRGAEYVQEALRMLSAEGIHIALDDFGTGYASLTHLNHFPVDVIKIDRSFIEKLYTSSHDATIVRAVIKLGRSLGIKVVAEGIETEIQAEFLRKHRCHSGQGYLFGRAVSASTAQTLAANWDNRRPANDKNAGMGNPVTTPPLLRNKSNPN